MVAVMVPIMPVMVIVAPPRHCLADERARSGTSNCANRSAYNRADRASGDGAAQGVFTSSCIPYVIPGSTGLSTAPPLSALSLNAPRL
jgi:hypothetical protein